MRRCPCDKPNEPCGQLHGASLTEAQWKKCNGEGLSKKEQRQYIRVLMHETMPSLAKQAGNLAKATLEHAMAGFKKVDEELFKKRIATCEGCEYYRNQRCLRCGCRMNIKGQWAEQKCPENKWPLPIV